MLGCLAVVQVWHILTHTPPDFGGSAGVPTEKFEGGVFSSESFLTGAGGGRGLDRVAR